MSDVPAIVAPPDRIDVPIRRGELLARLSMTPRDARELRDWLAANVRDEPFGGTEP